jgi:cyclohexyl-isocyanide hydratase
LKKIKFMKKIKSIGFVLYEGFNSLDAAGPYQVFYWMSVYLKNEISLYLIGPEKNAPIKSSEGMQWICDTSYEDALEDLDIIMVPGGGGAGFDLLLENKDDAYHQFYHLLESRAPKATLVCSVCVGALLLAKAGLLEGYTCTSHWITLNQLAQFPGVRVASGFPRYVIDRNRVTGGGVSSGIDEALAIAEMIAGAEMARQVQLVIQYAPNPPHNSGDPSVASATTLYHVSTHS